MLDTITSQMKDAFKPITELATINAKALETMTQKNSEFFSEMVSAGVSYAEGFGSFKDFSEFTESQKTFAEGMQSKVVEAAKDNYAIVTETTEKAGEIMKGMFSQVEETVKAAPKVAAKAAAK